MTNILIRALLCLSGVTLFMTGTIVMLEPQALFAASSATLDTVPGLLSELRSPGVLLMASGVIIILGGIRKDLTMLALMLSVLVYGTFGISRLFSLIFDGMPPTSILAAMGLELGIGAISLFLLFGQRNVQSHTTALSQQI